MAKIYETEAKESTISESILMKNIKSNYKTCQRADKPDELTMIALRNKHFAKRFVEVFKNAKGGKS